jgi:hypothetical protein
MGSCYFFKQPSIPAELDQAVAAVEGSCVCAVRYRGSEPTILKRLPNKSIDHAFPLEFIGSTYAQRPILSTPNPGFLESLFRRFK